MSENAKSSTLATRGFAVRCQGIEKSFGAAGQRIQVLRGADFEARLGEITFLVGPSGCGKTTLISVIGGILSADAGEIEVLGQDLRRLGSGRLADFRLEKLGFIFQQFNLLPSLTAIENASIPLVAQRLPMKKAEAQAAALLARLGLADHGDKLPAQLSGGQQQRVAIARALAHSPRLLICDEPTASLDAAAGRQVMELMQEVARERQTSVIVVTHDTRIFDFADRILHMSDGVITRSETKVEREGT